MKIKNLVLLACIIGVLPLSASAYMTTDDTTSEEFLLNHGYSKQMTELIDLNKCQVNGREYVEPAQPAEYEKQPVKAIRIFFKYLDPSLDDRKFMQHDTNPSVRWSDL